MTRRLFIAIDLPREIAWELARLVADPPPGVRPVRPAQLHLTLHFLGDVADEPREALPDALAGVARDSFTVAIRGTGVFPPRGRPSVLWAGLVESPALADLHAAVGAAVQACGLAVERRPYVPHVTLARLTPAVTRAWMRRFLADTAGLRIDAVPVDGFTVYRSLKRDGGTDHVVEATFPLVRHRDDDADAAR